MKTKNAKKKTNKKSKIVPTKKKRKISRPKNSSKHARPKSAKRKLTKEQRELNERRMYADFLKLSRKKSRKPRELSSEAKEKKIKRVVKRTKKNFKYAKNFKNKTKSYSRYMASEKFENVEGYKFKFPGIAVIDAENAHARCKELEEKLYDKFHPVSEYHAEKKKNGYVYGMGFLLQYQRYTGTDLQIQDYEGNITVLVFSDLDSIVKNLFTRIIKSLKTYNSITVILEGRLYRKSYSKKAKFPDTDYGKKT